MAKLWVPLIVVGLLIGLVVFTGADYYQISDVESLNHPIAKPQRLIATKSKFQIVTEVNQVAFTIHKLERILGKTGAQGYKIYTAKETEQLIKQYQILSVLLHYLNWGDYKTSVSQWEGYSFISENNKPYERDQIVRIMNELAYSKVPQSFVANLRIFLLPYVIPEVSGLGGNDYILLSARAIAEDLIDNQLSVTLYHEIGHHINFIYMTKDTLQGQKLWSKYLRIRGGTWHGPGNVNTKAWGESSEETFAEDFRMLFGKDQPFFGDLALGDPRSDSLGIKDEKQFMINLVTKKAKHNYRSPWIPEQGLWFWQIQEQLLISLWIFVGVGILAVNDLKKLRSPKPNTSFNS